MLSNVRNTFSTHILCSAIIIISTLFACSYDYSVKESHYSISLEQSDTVDFADIVSDYEYIVLDEDSLTTMSEMKQIIVSDRKIYVMANGIFCYSDEGKQLFKIVCKGHATSEFIDCTSMSVYDGKIYLYDRFKRRVMLFDSKDGQYLTSISTPECISNVYRVSENFLLDNTGFETPFIPERVRFVDTDSTLSVKINSYLDKELYMMGIHGQLSVSDNCVIFTDYFHNESFRYSNNKFVPFLSIENNEKISETEINQLVQEVRLPSNEMRMYGLRNVFENNTHIVGEFCYKSSQWFFTVDKETGHSISYKGVHSELYQLKPAIICASSGEYFYRFVSGASLNLLKDIYGFGLQLNQKNQDFQKQQLLEYCADKQKNILIRFKYKRI